MVSNIQEVMITIRDWTNSHYYLKSFETINLVGSNNYEYPLVGLTPSQSIFDKGSHILTLRAIVIDKLLDDLSNNITVQTNTLLAVEDLYNQFYDNDIDYNFTVSDIYNIESVEDITNDKVSGWSFDIDIELTNLRNEKAIPLSIFGVGDTINTEGDKPLITEK